MTWETRGDRKYYYKAVRVEGKPRKIYLGSGPAGRAHEILDRQAARKKQPLREAQARVRHLMREGDRLWNETWSWLWPLGEAYMHLAGYYRHRGQWRPALRKPRSRQACRRIHGLEPATDLRMLLKSLNRQANSGDPESLSDLREFLTECPAILTRVETLNRMSLKLWEDHQFRPDEAGAAGLEPFEQVLMNAVCVAELNRRHADSLLEAGDATALEYAARHARIEKADNRLRRAQRLMARMKAIGRVLGRDPRVTSREGSTP